jgi:hypothetical protein
MKNRGTLVAVQVAWLLAAALGSPAQTTGGAPTPANTDLGGRVVVPSTTPTAPVTTDSLRPLAEKRTLPAEVNLRLERFKADAQAYLARQETLRRAWQGASADERARIRLQLENLRAEWLKRAKELRKDFTDRREELLRQMPSHQELLMEERKANLREDLKSQIKDQQRDIRDRRGTD